MGLDGQAVKVQVMFGLSGNHDSGLGYRATHERVFPIPGKDTQRLAPLTRQYNVRVCAGLAEEVEAKLYAGVSLDHWLPSLEDLARPGHLNP